MCGCETVWDRHFDRLISPDQFRFRNMFSFILKICRAIFTNIKSRGPGHISLLVKNCHSVGLCFLNGIPVRNDPLTRDLDNFHLPLDPVMLAISHLLSTDRTAKDQDQQCNGYNFHTGILAQAVYGQRTDGSGKKANVLQYRWLRELCFNVKFAGPQDNGEKMTKRTDAAGNPFR